MYISYHIIFILYSIFNITSSLGYEYSNIVINYASFTHELHIDYIFRCNIYNNWIISQIWIHDFLYHLHFNYILFTHSYVIYLILDYLSDINPWFYLPFTHQLHIDYIFICNIYNIESSLRYESMILFTIYTSITYYLHIHM